MQLNKRIGALKRNSIKTRLILLFMIIILLAGISLGAFSLQRASSMMKNEAEKALTTMAEEGAKYTNSRIEQQIHILKAMALDEDIVCMDWERQQPMLKLFVEGTDFLDLAVVNMEGIAQYSNGDTSDLSDRAYVKKALSGEANVSDLLISKVTNTVVLMYATPIMKDDKVVGALIGRRDGNALSDIVKNTGYGNSGYSYMLNTSGVIVAHPDSEKVMSQFNPLEEVKKDSSLTSLAQLFQKAIEEKDGYSTYNYNKKELYAGYAPIEGSNWIFVIAAEQDEVLAAIPEIGKAIMLITVIILLLSVILVYIIGSGLTKPIIKVVELSKEIAALNITKNVPLAYLNKKDEVGELSRALQDITDSLRNIINEISESAEKVATASKELSDTSGQLATSAEEVANTVGEIANGASEQAKDLENGFDKASVLGETIEKDQGNILELNTASKKVTDAVAEGMEVIEILSVITEENNAASKEVHEVILKTHESSNRIGEASTMISSIAKQTNLLALNASIEAARAGEAGKGFAVVAEQIRKLAEMSSESTKEIDGIVYELQENSQSAMETIRKVTEITERQNLSVKNSKDKYLIITKAMKAAEIAVLQMNASGEEMERMKTEILGTLENLSAIAEENSASTEEVSAAMEEQSAAVEEMASSCEGLTEMAQRLQSIINRFQI